MGRVECMCLCVCVVRMWDCWAASTEQRQRLVQRRSRSRVQQLQWMKHPDRRPHACCLSLGACLPASCWLLLQGIEVRNGERVGFNTDVYR